MTAFKRLIALDFDGVLHSYTSPWTDAATIADPPTPGAMQFLKDLVDDGRFDVVIVSSRLKDVDGYDAVAVWLDRELRAAFGNNGIYVFDNIKFSVERPPAFLTIDDRGLTFTGTWPDLDQLVAFKPWNKRPPATIEDVKLRDLAAAVADNIEHGNDLLELERADLAVLLMTTWSMGATTANGRRDRPVEYRREGLSDDQIAEADVKRVIENRNVLIATVRAVARGEAA